MYKELKYYVDLQKKCQLLSYEEQKNALRCYFKN